MLDSLFRRATEWLPSGELERMTPTPIAVGGGFALAHASVAGLPAPFATFGLAPGGLDLAAPDGVEVRIVALLFSPAEDPDVHLQALSALARLLSHERSRGPLMGAATADDLVDAVAVVAATSPEVRSTVEAEDRAQAAFACSAPAPSRTSNTMPAFCRRSRRASPIASAVVSTPYRSGSRSRSRARQRALSPASWRSRRTRGPRR